MYSGCNLQYFVVILLFPASFLANSFDGSRISQVAKLRLQKYLAGIPAAFKSSSNFSFFRPADILVFMSVTIKDRVFGCTVSTNSVIGRIRLPWKYWAYFSALSFF